MAEQSTSWIAGAFMASTNKGEFCVAGWLKGSFALDFRIWWPLDEEAPCGPVGWMLTHIPLGWGVIGLLMSLEEAQNIADEMAGWGDWSVIEPANAGFHRHRFMMLRSRLGPLGVHPKELVPPWARTTFVNDSDGGHWSIAR